MRAARRKLLNIFLTLVLLLAVYNLTISTRRAPKRSFLHSLEWLLPASAPGRKSGHISSTTASNAINSASHSRAHIHYPVSSFIPLPSGSAVDLPKIQYNFNPEGAAAKAVREKRLGTVREALVHSWQGYRKYAWLYDEVTPMSGGYRTTFGGWAASMVDGLDTLWIMGLHEEFAEAVAAAVKINFNVTERLPLNVFETTIRYLGGLLGAYDVSDGKYPELLQKAREVGEMLYGAFDTPNRMPITRWEKAGGGVASGNTLVAELGSLSLEFTRLSQLTGEPKFFDAIRRITNGFNQQQNTTRLPGMWPVNVNARELDFGEDTGFTLGGMSDSVYEYLPKEYLLLGGLEFQYRRLYQTALIPIKQHILFRPMTIDNSDILLSGNVQSIPGVGVTLDPEVQHLGCFAGGMIALGAKLFNQAEDLEIARKLVDGCIWAYNLMPTGIMPELFHVVPCPAPNRSSGEHCAWDADAWGMAMMSRNSFDEQPMDKKKPFEQRLRDKAQRLRLPKGVTAIGDRTYRLRPEAIESIFVLYRITGDERLREEAWKMFEAIVAETRTEIAFASIDDVTWKHSPKNDEMESFWMAETLKYLYLLYSEPDVVSLDDFVFNTEAHPLRIPK